ncbi:MAG: YdiU family protein [Gammaproteobacteria bacterium]|nr:YdiU family protein [Gammaproteobacteria bacterium]
MSGWQFDNRFVNELPADPQSGTQRRQVHNACYSFVEPAAVTAPALVAYAAEVAELLDLTAEDCQSDWFLQVMAGNRLLDGMQPHAMCYGGHQFGMWAGQLGDGRAINLGEVRNQAGQHWSLQLKGAGETPYSRSADGLAVLRSSIREFVCSEAMHHLGVPTTRALSLVTTGEEVMRDIMYDGHPAAEPGAVVCRVAPSFIRFGNFQIFAARDQHEELRTLADFTIRHYFPDILGVHEAGSAQSYLAWFERVCDLTVEMVVHWMRVGFVHGVMNTDNMSIHGLTIDYGPYGWLDNFDPDWTPNTTDAQGKRYRYSQQPNIALWNCYQLANSLHPLIEDSSGLEAALQQFQLSYVERWRAMMASKLGLADFQPSDEKLFAELEKVLAQLDMDMTNFYRYLSTEDRLLSSELIEFSYRKEELNDEDKNRLRDWLQQYAERLKSDGRDQRQRHQAMQQVNPVYLFRNYLAQQAIENSEQGDHQMLHELLNVLRRPYEEQSGMEAYAAMRPDWARNKVGCSMLSCSS